MALFNSTIATAIYGTILVVQKAEALANEPQPLGILADYQPSLKELLGHEGGYTNDPMDPGGPTNWGITIFDAKMYWKPNATAADVRSMPLAIAKDIYRKKYWDRVRGDELPAGVDYCVFDYAVNSGIHRAIPLLQKLVGVTPDGVMGPETMKAVAAKCGSLSGRARLINDYQQARLMFLQGLKTWPHFGGGWGTRVREVRVLALKMSSTPPVPEVPVQVEPPVNIPRVQPPTLPPPPPAPAPNLGLFAASIMWALKTLFGKRSR